MVSILSQHRHFGRAARQLGISQPALSRALAQLEHDLGAPVFDRRTMRPTEFGRILLRHSSRVLAALADAHQEISCLKKRAHGAFSIAMGPYPAAISGQKAVALLAKLYSDISIEVRVTDWVEATEAVVAEAVDLAFADHSDARESPDLDVTHVRTEPVSVFCRPGHPLSAKNTVELQDLFFYPWVGPVIPLRGDLKPSAEMPCGTLDGPRRVFKPRIIVPTFEAIKEIALTSDALAAATPSQIADDVQVGRVIALLQFPYASLNYGFIRKRERALSAAAQTFMDLVIAIERDTLPNDARAEIPMARAGAPVAALE